jgi:hypothetical protein
MELRRRKVSKSTSAGMRRRLRRLHRWTRINKTQNFSHSPQKFRSFAVREMAFLVWPDRGFGAEDTPPFRLEILKFMLSLNCVHLFNWSFRLLGCAAGFYVFASLILDARQVRLYIHAARPPSLIILLNF